MTPDTNIKDYYLKFINDAKKDVIEYNKELELLNDLKIAISGYLKENKIFFKDTYNINLNDYIEVDLSENANKFTTLYNKVLKLTNNEENNNNKIKLLQLVKYYNIVKRINDYNKLIILADTRKKLKFADYKKLVMDYYNQVHKTVLQGMGYKFSNQIGIFCINRWVMDLKAMQKKKKLDFAATTARKKELLAQGKKLYNDNEAAWYKARYIPYDGVDYRVYKTQTHFYDITFVKSVLCPGKSLDFKHSEYINAKHRGKSYKQLAKSCKTLDDIANFKVDIRYKLNMLLHNEPHKYLMFIRNAEQRKYKYRADNSEN